MNAAEFASMIHRDLASQAASAFAVAKSPVSQKDEDEEHEKRLHRMTRAGSPCSSGDEGSPQASPQKPVAQAVVEVKAPSNPTTPRRRPSRNTRSSLPTTPSQRGPFGAVATELAAEVINNCVRSFVYRCLRKKMARAQHEWKRWMEQRSDRGVPSFRGAFTPSTRVVSRNDGSGWSFFRFSMLRAGPIACSRGRRGPGPRKQGCARGI